MSWRACESGELTQKAAFKTPANRWTRVIIGDLPSINVDGEIIEPATIVIARAGFTQELERSQKYQSPYRHGLLFVGDAFMPTWGRPSWRKDRRRISSAGSSRCSSCGLAGSSTTDAAYARATSDLEARGDTRLALYVAKLGLARFPSSRPVQEARQRALTSLRQTTAQTDPFRFIIYSELAGQGLPPMQFPAGIHDTADDVRQGAARAE